MSRRTVAGLLAFGLLLLCSAAALIYFGARERRSPAAPAV